MYQKPGVKTNNHRFAGGLEKQAWDTFSYYVKLKMSNDAGYVRCCSCMKPILWAGKNAFLHAGHYFSWVGYPQLRLSELNVWPQCQICNYGGDKNNLSLGKFIEDRLTNKEFSKLNELSKFKYKEYPDRQYLGCVIIQYKQKIKELQKLKLF